MLTALVLLAANALPPKPQHYVTDRAGVLPNAAALDAKLADFERQTSDQILVYVDQQLPPDTSIEEMGSQAMRQWGLGQKGKDNGAILFVFIADRKMRIEVGYGLEGSLTDAKSKWITSTVIKPRFQSGDIAGGINNGIDAMLAAVRGEVYRGTGRTVAQARRHGIPSWLIAVSIGFLWVVGFPAFIVLAVRKRWVTTGSLGGSSTSFGGTFSSSGWSSSSSSFSSDSSSSSSDSFSGGGGSGGGGGASDSW